MNEDEKDALKLSERSSMFNDAVYAIVMTLLVLELKLPENLHFDTRADMLHVLHEMKPKLLAFLLSILMVGGQWIASVNVQRLLIKADMKFLIYSVIYLSIISLTPFTCNLMGNFPFNPVSYTTFGVVMILMATNATFFLRYCRKKNFFHPHTDIKEIIKLEKQLPVLILCIVATIVVAYFSTLICLILFLIFNLLPFVLTKPLKLIHPY